MKYTLTFYFTIIFIIALCTNTYATELVDGCEEHMDTKVGEIIESQLSWTEKEFIGNTLPNEVLLKVYNQIPWSLAWKSSSEMIAEAEKNNEPLMYKDYYVLSNTPYRVIIGQGKVWKDEESDVPQYVHDILELTDQVEINGKLSAVTGVYCIDGSASYYGSIVYIFTSEEGIVKYYEYPFSEALVFSEDDFKKYAKDYDDYISSYEYNHNEFGEITGGRTLSFKEFIESESHSINNVNRNEIKQTKVKSIFSSHITIFGGIILETLLLISLFKFFNRRKTR